MAQIAKALDQDLASLRNPNPDNIVVGDFVFFDFWNTKLFRGLKGQSEQIGKVIDLYSVKGFLFTEIKQLTNIDICKRTNHKQIPVRDLKRLDPLKASIIIANKRKK